MKLTNGQDRNYVSSRSRVGAVLIIVLWIAFGLVSVTLYFGRSMFFEYKGANQATAGAQAEQANNGALRYFFYTLNNALEEEGDFPSELIMQTEQIQIGQATVWMLGRSGETVTLTDPHFGVIDECAKININTAPFEVLELLPTITPEFAAAIVDWRDEDDDVTENGAEALMYSLQSLPYGCKNAPFETVEELRLVYGATVEMLYGEDTNLNGVLDPSENDGMQTPPLDNQDGILNFGILEHVTIYSKMLAEEESEDMDSSNNSENQAGNRNSQQQRGGEEEVPFQVNVTTASAIVLACLPGMDEATAQQIVSYRLANPDSTEGLEWVSEAVDSEMVQQALPYLTDKTQQFTLDLAAIGSNGNGYRRVRYVVDASGEAPVVLHRRDMQRFGWALGPTLLEKVNTPGQAAR
jgi:type II secretory pathway component PulK